MRSPICHLEPYISGVALNIAPEQKEALLALRDRHNLSFELTDKQESEDASKNIIGIDVTTGVISLPIAALEYLWSCAYTYWVVNQEYAKAQHAGQEKFNATGNERLRDAATLTVWGKNNISTSGVMVWPKTLPDPTQSHLPHDDISIANELFCQHWDGLFITKSAMQRSDIQRSRWGTLSNKKKTQISTQQIGYFQTLPRVIYACKREPLE
jgi:hypothetical protein